MNLAHVLGRLVASGVIAKMNWALFDGDDHAGLAHSERATVDTVDPASGAAANAGSAKLVHSA
jgi:hypothetical protein